MIKKTLRLGTRGSRLALAQAGLMAEALRRAHIGLEVELVEVKTQGDLDAEAPLASIGGLGLFTKTLEEALLAGSIDAAAHSLKDLPTRQPKGLVLAAITAREDWRDAWICPSGLKLQQLPAGARVGTGSPRRRAQLARLRPDLQFVELRGNLDTRLRKLREGQAAGAPLAAAGLARLGLLSISSAVFGEEVLPAPGQGFLTLECRQNDVETIKLLAALDDSSARACALAERALLDEMGAGCHAAVAALARISDSRLRLQALSQNQSGMIFEDTIEGDWHNAEAWGRGLARRLYSQGAEMRDEGRRTSEPS